MAKNNVNEQHDETTDTPAFVYHPTKFTEYYVKRHNLKLLPNGTFAEYRKAHVLRTMWLDYMTIAVPKRYFTKTDLADALTLFCDTHRELAVIELRTQLKCEFEDLAPLKSWLKAVTGKEDKLDVAVWAHALCNLKRKLWNLETYWEMMPVLVGKQGSGKSRAIMKLLSPIDHVTLNYEVTQATDPTIAVNFSTHYACFFDELSKGTSTNIEAIKRLISAVRINARLMYENEAGSFDQRCTFFGASNKSVGEVFRDETGARRFHDTQSADMTDRNVINSLNYISLLQGIDETRGVDEAYILPFEQELRAKQEALKAVDIFEDFIVSVGWTPGTKEAGEFISIADITQKYFNEYAAKNNVKLYESSYIGTRLTRLGFEQVRLGKDGIRGRYIIKTKSLGLPVGRANMKLLT